MARQAKYLITAEDQTKAGVQSAIKGILDLDGAAKKVGDSLKSAFTVVAIAESLKKLADFGLDCVKSFGDMERTMTQLKTALGGNEERFRSMTDLIDELSGKTLEGKDAIEKMVAELASLGKSDADINRISEAAVALSNVTGKSLTESMTALLNAENGNVKALKAFVPGVLDLTDAQLKAGAAADLVTAKFGAISDSMAGGVSQQLSNLSKKWDDFKEAFGANLAPLFSPMIGWIGQIVQRWTDAFDQQNRYHEALKGNSELDAALVKQIETLRTIEILQRQIAADSDQGLLTTNAQNKLSALMYELNALNRRIQELRVPTASPSGSTTDSGGSSAPIVYGNPDDQHIMNATWEDYAAYLASLSDHLKNAGNNSKDLKNNIKEMASLKDSFGEGWSAVISSLTDRFKSWGELVKSIATTIENGIASALESVGKALVTGEMDWNNLGATAMAVLADILRSIAAQLAGLAAVKLLTLDFVGAGLAAAAAAAALIAAGAADAYASSLTSSSTDTSTSTDTPGYSGTSASYAGSQPITFNFYNNGNVLGDSGFNELADIIYSIFRKNERYA